MKFTWNTLKSGLVSFIFTPVLMFILVVLVLQDEVNSKTELHPWVVQALDMRYSADGILLMLLASLVISLLAVLILRIIDIPRHKAIRVASLFDVVAYLLTNLFLFWAGVFVAWSFGSPLIDFVQPIPGQIIAIPMFMLIAVFSRLGLVKLKHYAVRG